MDFREQFWSAYRRKTDRKKAMVVLDRLHRWIEPRGSRSCAGAERLSASETETEFLPHASTWLRNERWNDETAPPKAPRGPHGGAPLPPRRKSSNGFYDIAREPDLGDYDEQHSAPQRNLLRFAAEAATRPLLDLVSRFTNRLEDGTGWATRSSARGLAPKGHEREALEDRKHHLLMSLRPAMGEDDKRMLTRVVAALLGSFPTFGR